MFHIILVVRGCKALMYDTSLSQFMWQRLLDTKFKKKKKTSEIYGCATLRGRFFWDELKGKVCRIKGIMLFQA